ncbi:MAG: DUF4920 domain-containing protein [bacterium]|nr:DUF4920 domain-containing protein [bacterium]
MNTIKKVLLSAFAIILFSANAYSQDHKDTGHKEDYHQKAPAIDGINADDGIIYGQAIDPSATVLEFADLMKNPSDNDGKIVYVKGNVAEVCQKMGCWMTMTEGSTTARVLTMHEFLLPKDVSGRNAVVVGKFKVTEITEDEARHYNSESKNPLKEEDIVGPQKTFEIEASGIKILNQ